MSCQSLLILPIKWDFSNTTIHIYIYIGFLFCWFSRHPKREKKGTLFCAHGVIKKKKKRERIKRENAFLKTVKKFRFHLRADTVLSLFPRPCVSSTHKRTFSLLDKQSTRARLARFSFFFFEVKDDLLLHKCTNHRKKKKRLKEKKKKYMASKSLFVPIFKGDSSFFFFFPLSLLNCEQKDKNKTMSCAISDQFFFFIRRFASQHSLFKIREVLEKPIIKKKKKTREKIED